jgi:hypothetical protein
MGRMLNITSIKESKFVLSGTITKTLRHGPSRMGMILDWSLIVRMAIRVILPKIVDG